MVKRIYLNKLTPEEVIKRLKNGEVIHFEGNDLTLKMIDGIIIERGRDCTGFNYAFIVDRNISDYYFEEEPFEITETGVYKTRDGRKAFVYKISDETNTIYPIHYIVEKEDDSILATKQGKYDTGETELDIVAKWED